MPIYSRFFKHILTLFTGSAAAQTVTFLFYLALARVYLPEHFGLFAIYTATVIIIGEVINGRYDLSIMLPSDEKDSVNLLRLCLLITFSVTVIIGIFIFPLNLIFDFYGMDNTLRIYLLFVPLSIFFTGITQPLLLFLNRKQKYKTISWHRFLQAFFTGSISFSLGFTIWKSYGLLAGFICGQLLALIFILIIFRKDFKLIFFNYPLKSIIKLAKTYSNFPKYSVSSALLNTAGRQSPFYLLALFFGTEVTGHFNLAIKLLTAPVMLISGAYGQVFYERATKIYKIMSKELKPFVVKNARNLFLTGIIPLVIAFIWGQQIVVWLLGAQWSEAGLYFQYLSPFAFMLFIINPLSFILNILDKLGAELIYNMIMFTARVGVLIVGGLFLSASMTVIGFSALGVAFNLFLLFFIFAITNSNTQIPFSKIKNSKLDNNETGIYR